MAEESSKGIWIGAIAVLLVIVAFASSRDGQAPPEDGSNENGNTTAELPNKAVGGGEEFWVTTPRLERRTCPSLDCGVVGQLFFREAATVLERKGDWARITQAYDAGCAGGRSEYVDSGKAACTAENGITSGRFAEWVLLKSLSATRPPDPAKEASDAERLVAESDDFAQHRAAFVRAANQLIESGRCTHGDFEEMGGWVKSSNHRDEPIYFTYCGGMTTANRVYLDAKSGRIF